MANGGSSDRIPVNINQDALDAARGIANRSTNVGFRKRQFSGITGEQAARDYIRRTYRNRIVREIEVPVRMNGVPVLDTVFELDNGEFVVVEAKGGRGKLGKVRAKRFVVDAKGRVRAIKTKIRQFSAQWFDMRLREMEAMGSGGRRLAFRLRTAWSEGKITPLVVRAPEHTKSIEHVVVESFASEWNEFYGVSSAALPPGGAPTAAVARAPSTDPARQVASGAVTNVERGLEVAERVETKAAPASEGVRALSHEKGVVRAVEAAKTGLKARSLRIGVKAWRVTRTVGKVAIVCFVPLTLLDVVIEVASRLWERHEEKKAREQRDRQKALQAVLQDPKVTKLIEQKILGDTTVMDRFWKSWDSNRKLPGFLYARIWAELERETFQDLSGAESEDLTTYEVTALNVVPTDWAHELELSDIGDPQEREKSEADIGRLFDKGMMYPSMTRKVLQRRRLKYTIVPPLLTPFDVVVTKINNLFLDIAVFIASFSGRADEVLESFKGFDFRFGFDEQFGVVIEYPAPLNPSACAYCLSYLHWAAKTLSHHPLEQADLEGNLEDPRKGWRRRFRLLNMLLDGRDTRYKKNFSFMAAQVKNLVRKGERDDQINEALAQLYEGARAIFYDLERIEANISHPEYYYYGPSYPVSSVE